ncbi:MAG: GNAT family N-acetyltransferase [Pseudomonadales bacterium]|nr:GNAT family N-acetyltransferase [Pseudomonadales bacterium]
MVEIRKAQVSDARQCSEVLCSSIRELCSADHNDDEQLILKWIDNKTEENFRKWILDESTQFFVAEFEEKIRGVGAINLPDEVALNYVSPKFRYKGISRAILVVLENALIESGCCKGRLTSTITAHKFYQASGWADVKMMHSWPGLDAHVMEKKL